MSDILIPGLSQFVMLALDAEAGNLGEVVLDRHYPVVRVSLGPVTAEGQEGAGVLVLVDPDPDPEGPDGFQNPAPAGTRSFTLFGSQDFSVRSPFNTGEPARVRFLGVAELAGTFAIVQGFDFAYGEA